MQPSLNRQLVVLSLLITGALALSGKAEASEPYLFSLKGPSEESALLPVEPVEPFEPSASGTYRAIEVELGLVPPAVKQEAGEDSSGADWLAGPPLDPGDAVGGLPPILSPPPLAEPSSPASVSLGRKRLPPYEIHDRPEVRGFVDRYQTGYRRAVVEKWLIRSGRYLDMIREVFVQRGLPEELIFTAMIESGFDPIAASRAGARGLWQFMAPTARLYGLRVDRWTDERLDPEKSTRAAAAYLKDLFTMYGSWTLAQAAYNGGALRINRAIQSLKTTDFWQLTRGRHLAEETKNFVAAIQAAVVIAREPERYGFSVTPEPALRYETIRVPANTKLPRIAADSGIDPADLKQLNPELRQGQTPPSEAYALKVPPGGADKVRVVLEREATQRAAAAPRRGAGAVASTPHDADGVHVVKPQDTVGGIAKRYGVSVAEIRRWNQLSEQARIFPGNRLRVAMTRTATREEGQGGFR
jgi:membrane-bound lytic murein transglycosylase D